MRWLPEFSRRARWAVPGGAAAIVAAVTAVSVIGVAQASPELPARTPAQLLAAVAGRTGPPPALTGTVVETASLGIPQLPGTSNPTSITSLLSGSHTIRVWYADPQHIRLAVPVTMSETDLIRNGRTVWVWQSSSNTATKLMLPSRSGKVTPEPAQVNLTPQQAAQQALAAVGPSTAVSVQRNVTVAGQAAYQLVLTPKDSRSLVGRISIAVDAARNLPLRVQVFARGATTPAIQVGYTSISFVKPAAANFTFTPPPGATIRTHLALGPAGGLVGAPAEQVRLRPADGKAQIMPAGSNAKIRNAKIRNAKIVKIKRVGVKLRPVGANAQVSRVGPKVIGKDWLSVAVLPATALATVAGNGNVGIVAGQAARSVAGSPNGPGSLGGDGGAILGALLKSATPVHGTWGSGKLLQTSLVSILITNDHVFVGAVTPAVLYSAAAQTK